MAELSVSADNTLLSCKGIQLGMIQDLQPASGRIEICYFRDVARFVSRLLENINVLDAIGTLYSILLWPLDEKSPAMLDQLPEQYYKAACSWFLSSPNSLDARQIGDRMDKEEEFCHFLDHPYIQ